MIGSRALKALSNYECPVSNGTTGSMERTAHAIHDHVDDQGPALGYAYSEELHVLRIVQLL